MTLKFHPKPGTILYCDYDGFKEPEMVKGRIVVVVSPRLSYRDGLCTVVPLSTTEPHKILPYHYKLELERLLPVPWDAEYHWVKADMLATVGFYRLDLIRTHRDQEGKRKYLNLQVKDEDLTNIYQCMLHALGLSALTEHL